MKKILIFCVAAVVLFGCNEVKTFIVEGTVSDSEGKMLHIDHAGVLKNTPVDSVKLRSNGSFSFKVSAPSEFAVKRNEPYRLPGAVLSCGFFRNSFLKII